MDCAFHQEANIGPQLASRTLTHTPFLVMPTIQLATY